MAHAAQRLTLWNVSLPTAFLAKLTKLWWLDIRGGSGKDLAALQGTVSLRYLAVNQVRGMLDLSLAAAIPALEYLDLYGLPQVTRLPSFRNASNLEHARLGQLRGLSSLDGVLGAMGLRELELARTLTVSSSDVDRIRRHPTLERFAWFAEDVPDKVWVPVVKAIQLPPVPHLSPEEWFKRREGTT
jgi:hypothetical protein